MDIAKMSKDSIKKARPIRLSTMSDMWIRFECAEGIYPEKGTQVEVVMQSGKIGIYTLYGIFPQTYQYDFYEDALFFFSHYKEEKDTNKYYRLEA